MRTDRRKVQIVVVLALIAGVARALVFLPQERLLLLRATYIVPTKG